MFSPVTMASSTTMPSTRMKANRLMMLMVTPSQGSRASAPAKVMGMPTHTQTATEKRRNRASSTNTSRPPWMALLVSVFRRDLTMRERSRQ